MPSSACHAATLPSVQHARVYSISSRVLGCLHNATLQATSSSSLGPACGSCAWHQVGGCPACRRHISFKLFSWGAPVALFFVCPLRPCSFRLLQFVSQSSRFSTPWPAMPSPPDRPLPAALHHRLLHWSLQQRTEGRGGGGGRRRTPGQPMLCQAMRVCSSRESAAVWRVPFTCIRHVPTVPCRHSSTPQCPSPLRHGTTHRCLWPSAPSPASTCTSSCAKMPTDSRRMC